MPELREQFAGFTVVDRLGSGGMGEVYLVRNPRLERLDALKVLRPAFGGDDDSRSRFLYEARLAATLHHPNIVTIYDAGEAESRLYIDMQYIDGPDLRRVLEREGRLRPARALAILGQIAAALDAAHMQGLLHRDVKPENMLLSRPAGYVDEHAYLTDFGIGKFGDDATSRTASGEVVGTPAYLAPERQMGQADHRVDVYSLGCVLYEVLVGKPPFEATSIPALWHAHASAPRPKPSEQDPSLPRFLDDVIARALALAPQDRFNSCGELVAAARQSFSFDTGQRTNCVTPIPVVSGQTTGRSTSRRLWQRPVPIILVSLALVVAAFAMGFLLRNPTDTKQASSRAASNPPAPVLPIPTPTGPSPAPSTTPSSPGPPAVETQFWSGPVGLASGSSLNFDTLPPSPDQQNTGIEYNSLGLGTNGNPDPSTPAVALWTQSRMPSQVECRDWISTHPTRIIAGPTGGERICIRTEQGRYGVLKVEPSSDTNTLSATATIWNLS